DNLRPNRERFPTWNEQLAADMRDETLAFFEHVVWQQRRPLSDLMNAQVTFATPRLAKHYGLSPEQAVGQSAESQNPTAGSSIPSSVSRVTEGLRTLYTFAEGTGETVRDLSGADAPLNLTISDPSAVRWSEQGLTINSSTRILSDGS